MGLTVKQQAFVDHYHVCGNATQAAIKAGYSKSTAISISSKLLTNSGIKEALEEKQKQLAAAKAITTDWLIANAKAVLEYSIQLKGKSKTMISPRYALQANEQIAKLTGLLTQQQDTNITIQVERQEKQLEVLEDFSDYQDQVAVPETTPIPNLQLVPTPTVDG